MNLLPLVEGLRPGASLELGNLVEQGEPGYYSNQKRYLEFCLKKFGLFFREDDYQDYWVSRDRVLLDQLWHEEISIGEFLGYPKCCIGAFEEHIRLADSTEDKTKSPMIRFSREAYPLLQKGALGSALLYTLHVPCGLDCKESLALGRKMETVMKREDAETACFLDDFNRRCIFDLYYV